MRVAPTLVVALVLVACEEPPPATPPPSPRVEPVTPPTPPAPPPVVEAAPVVAVLPVGAYRDDTRDLIVTPSSITVHVDGGASSSVALSRTRCTETLPEGEGMASECTWESESCTGTLVWSSRVLPAGAWSSITLSAVATSPDRAAVCAGLVGSFSNGHASDPAAGGPPPPPSFENAACLLRAQILSTDGTICAAVPAFFGAPPEGAPAPDTATVFRGPCCLGTELVTLTGTELGAALAVSDDGATLVVPRHERTLSGDDVRTNVVVVDLLRAGGTETLHVEDLFGGDPALAAGSTFGYELAVEGNELVTRVVGSTARRRSLVGAP